MPSPIEPQGTGSSPRTWGTLRAIRLAAGSAPVHPHARGEHAVTRSAICAAARFIPTHVGNTLQRVLFGHLYPVHPHARGEHSIWAATCTTFRGSSPRTWGTHRLGLRSRLGSRFIPTHVGNTLSPGSRSGTGSVHPHARGEHYRALIGVTALSVHPHARGEHPRQLVCWSCPCRFIPTHVGNTPSLPSEFPQPSGSSPRTWGTLGISSSSSSRIAVHPHARGEHALVGSSSCWSCGSSPRTWGTL